MAKVSWLARMGKKFDQAKCDNIFWPRPNILTGSVCGHISWKSKWQQWNQSLTSLLSNYSNFLIALITPGWSILLRNFYQQWKEKLSLKCPSVSTFGSFNYLQTLYYKTVIKMTLFTVVFWYPENVRVKPHFYTDS